jgi:hypothetical protein
MVNKFLPARGRAWSLFILRFERSKGMTSKGRQILLSTLDPSELEAQRIACRHLVKGCERALFHFGLIAGETPNTEAAQIDGRAVEIMRDALSSWRDTLSLLPTRPVEDKDNQAARSWMVMPPVAQRNSTLKRRME